MSKNNIKDRNEIHARIVYVIDEVQELAVRKEQARTRMEELGERRLAMEEELLGLIHQYREAQ